MSERLYRAVSRRAVVGFVVTDGEVVECAPYVRKLIMGLGELLAIDVLRRGGFEVSQISGPADERATMGGWEPPRGG